MSSISLYPLSPSAFDPAEGYPHELPLTTLKGYFGEALAGIVAESFSHFDNDNWYVPAYSFRFHEAAFDYLEKLRQGAKKLKAIPGRTGDDTLAFRMDSSGEVVGALVCEAKCTHKHDSGMIKKAHHQISDRISKPVEIRRMIEILLDYDDPISVTWREALHRLFFHDTVSNYERFDLINYVCGESPKQENRTSWIDSTQPHPDYSGNRRLEAVEIHLNDVNKLINKVYGVKESNE